MSWFGSRVALPFRYLYSKSLGRLGRILGNRRAGRRGHEVAKVAGEWPTLTTCKTAAGGESTSKAGAKVDLHNLREGGAQASEEARPLASGQAPMPMSTCALLKGTVGLRSIIS